MQNQSNFLRYYGKVFRRAFKSVWHFGRQQVIIAVIAAILILVLQIRAGMIAEDMNAAAWISVIVPYLLIIVVAFIVEAIRAPWLLDKDRQQEIQDERELVATQLQTDKVRAELTATQLELEQIRAEVAESQKHKLVFETDQRNTKIRLEQTAGAIRIWLHLQVRFENKGERPFSIKHIDVSLHRMGIVDKREHEDISTVFAILRVTSNGVQINKDEFEGTAIDAHKLSPLYMIETLLGIDDERIKTVEDLDAVTYLRVVMQSSGDQPEFTAKLFPHWEALKPEGTRLIHVIGAPSIPVDYRRLD